MVNVHEFVNSKTTGKFCDVGGCMIHYTDNGSGEPLLLIHGIGQSMYTFRNNIGELSGEFRVIAIDLPGFGYSDKPEIDYAIDEFSGYIIGLLDKLGINRTHIMAFSTGAMIALSLAEASPSRVKKLVLINPGGITPDYPAWVRRFRVPLLSDVNFLFLKSRWLERFLEDCYFDRTIITDTIRDQYLLPYEDNGAADALAAAVSNWDEDSVWEHMPKIKHPVFIFWSEDNRLRPIELLEEFEQRLPQSYVATVRNTGHLLHEEKYREINRKTAEVLSMQEENTYPEEEPVPAPQQAMFGMIYDNKDTDNDIDDQDADFTHEQDINDNEDIDDIDDEE